MKKLTALLLALLLTLSVCAVFAAAADDASVTVVLEPADETLLTADRLALFFVDRDAIDEEIETSVSWYKETTKDGKTERELLEEMPLVIRPGKGGTETRIFVADGYKPSQTLIDAVRSYAPEKDPDSEHVYRWHRVFNQDCRWIGLRYGTCEDYCGIEFDLARGPHTYGGYTDAGDYHVRSCTVCGAGGGQGEHTEVLYEPNEWTHIWRCPTCGHIFDIMVEPSPGDPSASCYALPDIS